jgi:hypothetical protein
VCRLSNNGEWFVVQSPEKARVMYLASTVDKVSAEARLMTGRILAASQNMTSGSPALWMMFAGHAADMVHLDILFVPKPNGRVCRLPGFKQNHYQESMYDSWNR